MGASLGSPYTNTLSVQATTTNAYVFLSIKSATNVGSTGTPTISNPSYTSHPHSFTQSDSSKVYYAAPSAQAFGPHNELIVLNTSSASPATVTMGSTIASDTITGNLSIANTAGDLLVHVINNTGAIDDGGSRSLTVTGNVTINNTGSSLVLDAGNGGTVTAAGNITINSDGNLAINQGITIEGTQAASAVQITNQLGSNSSASIILGINFNIYSYGSVSLTNSAGSMQFEHNSSVGGYGTNGVAAGPTTISDSSGNLTFYSSTIYGGTPLSSGGTSLGITDSSGNILINGGQIGLIGSGLLDIQNTSGNITVTGQAELFSSNGISIQASSTGNILLTNLTNIFAQAGTVSLQNLGTGNLTITNGAGDYYLVSGSPDAPAISIGVTSGNILINNGVYLAATAGNMTIVNLSGSTTVSGNAYLGASGTLSVTGSGGATTINTGAELAATGNITITNTGGALAIDTTPSTLNSSTLSSTSGSVAISDDQNITVTGYGSNFLNAPTAGVSFSSSTGSVSVVQTGLTSMVTRLAATTFSVTATNSSLTVGTITTNASGASANGSITLVAGCICPLASATTLTVQAGATVSANIGNVILQDPNSSQGSIVFGNGSTVEATQSAGALGNVYVVVGVMSSSFVTGSTPNN